MKLIERVGPIDTGDGVLHRPSGETWVVAYVNNGHLAWCGWPHGMAPVADCELVSEATAEYRTKLLRDMVRCDDSRGSYAQRRLQMAEEAQG